MLKIGCDVSEAKGKVAKTIQKVNLCSGPVQIEGYINVDMYSIADFVLDLEKDLLPFADESVDVLVCISAINYFTRQRAAEIIKDVYRVLKPGGVTRFASQDLRVLAEKYVNRDLGFYFQKLSDGRDRFPGSTIADKFNEFFYGFYCKDKHCKYVYDFESLKDLFERAGFPLIEQKKYYESIIPEINKIDNRPEQMFFLEAIKGQARTFLSNGQANKSLETFESPIHKEHDIFQSIDTDKMRSLAFDMWQNGEREKAWQYLLKVLKLKPDDRLAVAKCAEILRGLNRFEDLSKLCVNFLNLRPDDYEIKNIFEQTQKELKEIQQNSDDNIAQRRRELDRIKLRLNSIQPAQTHLSACLRWLTRAQKVNSGGGVAAAYHIDLQRWDVDYPETTGYIIPTVLGYYKLSGVESYRKCAIDMGDWEIAIQEPEGGTGEPVGVYGLRPRIFNTGQVILGWAALYRETGGDKYLTAAQRAAHWIMDNQNPDGKWIKSTYVGPRAYHIRVAWALLELYDITGEESYRAAARCSINWVLSQGHANGWFANNSLSKPNNPWTHLIGYVLVGLMKIYGLNNVCFDRQKTFSLLCNAAKGLANFYTKLKEGLEEGYFFTLPGTFTSDWSSTDNWSCITGNAQIAFFLWKMSKYTDDPMLLSAAESLINDLKQFHLLDGVTSPDVFGGMPGSYPIGADYLGYAIPNWGVKFFADSLLQGLLPEDARRYLG